MTLFVTVRQHGTPKPVFELGAEPQVQVGYTRCGSGSLHGAGTCRLEIPAL